MSQFCSVPVVVRVLVHPWHQLGRHKRLIPEVGEIGVVGVPRLVGKRGLDDGQVVLFSASRACNVSRPSP